MTQIPTFSPQLSNHLKYVYLWAVDDLKCIITELHTLLAILRDPSISSIISVPAAEVENLAHDLEQELSSAQRNVEAAQKFEPTTGNNTAIQTAYEVSYLQSMPEITSGLLLAVLLFETNSPVREFLCRKGMDATGWAEHLSKAGYSVEAIARARDLKRIPRGGEIGVTAGSARWRRPWRR